MKDHAGREIPDGERLSERAMRLAEEKVRNDLIGALFERLQITHFGRCAKCGKMITVRSHNGVFESFDCACPALWTVQRKRIA